MKTHSRKTAFAVAALLGAVAALPLAARADTALPGQPGANTTVSAQEQRSAPYMVMVIASNGAFTERQLTVATAAELMKNAKPLTGVMVLVHDGKAYLVQDTVMHGGAYDGQSAMKVITESMP